MTQTNNTRQLISDFILTIWNQRRFDCLDQFIHPSFVDHSLPPQLPADRSGLVQWIQATGASFEHITHITGQVTEDDKSMLKVTLQLKHIGEWRGIPATGAAISVVGYRYFRVAEDRIIEHWALIDGNSVEDQLKQSHHGCNPQAPL